MHTSILLLLLFFLMCCLNFSFFSYVCNIPSPTFLPRNIPSPTFLPRNIPSPTFPDHLRGKQQIFSPKKYHLKTNFNFKKYTIELNCHGLFQISILGLGLPALLCFPYLHICSHLKYVSFNTNLSLCTHRISSSHSGEYLSMYLNLILLGLAISEYPGIVLYILLNINLNCDTLFPCSSKFSKSISRTIFMTKFFR